MLSAALVGLGDALEALEVCCGLLDDAPIDPEVEEGVHVDVELGKEGSPWLVR